MASVVVSFLISTGGSLAQAVLDLFTQPPNNENLNEQIVRYNPHDNVCEEFDSSAGCWKAKRGSLWKSFVRSLWISLQIAFLSSFCIGLAAVCIILLDIVIKSKCETSTRLLIISEAVKVLVIYFWQPLLLLNVFRGQFLRKTNVFTTSLLGALLDIVIRIFLVLSYGYEEHWRQVIGNSIGPVVILVNGYNIGRTFFPRDKKQAAKVAFKFSAQFIIGAPAIFLVIYVLVPAFISYRQDTVSRLVLLGLAMITAFPVKVISRHCALSLQGINHPGNSCFLVAAAYGCTIISFRIFQAEVEGFATFIGLSLVHGVFQLVEVLMIKVEGVFSSKIRQCCGNRLRNVSREAASITRGEEDDGAGLGDESIQQEEQQHKTAHARLQRFLADTIIQGMLFETTALIFSVSIMQLYGIINVTSIEETSNMAIELAKRIYAGVFIEFVFSVCCVVILTRYMNIPILRVWDMRWKSHVTVFIITTVMSVLVYTDNMVDFVKMNLVTEGIIVGADAACR